jgi:hypothetical protein
MVVYVKVSDNEWNKMKDTVLTSRDVLSRELFETSLKKEGSFPGQRMDILLPTTVSIRERHTIHKMTLKNMFESSSFNDMNGERRMHIYMSKAFVCALINSNLETIVENETHEDPHDNPHEDPRDNPHDADPHEIHENVAEILTEVVTEIEKVGSEVTIDVPDDKDAKFNDGATLEIVTEPAVDIYTVKVNVTDTFPIPTKKQNQQNQSFFQKICQFVCRFGK